MSGVSTAFAMKPAMYATAEFSTVGEVVALNKNGHVRCLIKEHNTNYQ